MQSGQVASRLLAARADPNSQRRDCVRALHLAAEQGAPSLVAWQGAILSSKGFFRTKSGSACGAEGQRTFELFVRCEGGLKGATCSVLRVAGPCRLFMTC